MSKKINKGRLFRNAVLILLALGSAGLYFSNRFVKSKGFENLGDFISTYRTNKNLAENVEPTSMQLLLSDADYDFLKKKRQEAIDRGIQINDGDNYVPCQVVYNGDTCEGEMRLKGHMTDHLEGDKWSFRLKTEREVMGMYRFSLQNPATRNYAYEWVYHELLNQEGIIHLKYDFIALKLNDKDLGIYAVEEHFGQHVLRDNQRAPGAILRWNPELYWSHRISELDGTYLDEGYSGYGASFAEPYDGGVVKRDTLLIKNYQQGAALLEAFRRGEKSTAAVFDVDKMARFHAVIDLVGGYHSLDWSDIKFYYNSLSGKIEPVGYESFSVRETLKIAGQRTPEDYATTGFDYHDRLFADPVFFKAYIQNLERIASPAYFDRFSESIQTQLDQKRGILAKEFAYIKFSFLPYYDNITRIQRNLTLPKAFHAFLEDFNDSLVRIAITPVSDYPLEILALNVDGKKTYGMDSVFTLPPKARDTYAHYFYVEFPYQHEKLKNLTIKAQIPGSSHVFEVPVSDLPSYKGAEESLPNLNEQPDSSLVWVNDSVAVLKGSVVSITGLVQIPKNKTLIISEGQDIRFEEQGRFYIAGSLKIFGETGDVGFSSVSNSAAHRITIDHGEFLAINCFFTHIEGAFLKIDGGKVRFETCIIAETKDNFITAHQADVRLMNCAGGTMHSLGVFDQCIVKIKEFSGKKGNTFITSYGSDIEMYSSSLFGYNTVSDLDYNSNFSSWGSKFEGNGMLAKLNHVSIFNTYNSSILSGDLGFEVDMESAGLLGESSYELYKTSSAHLKTIETRRAG